MKKSLMVFALCFLFIFCVGSFVSAEDSVSDVLSEIIGSTNSVEDTVIVYGDDADAFDILSSYSISYIMPFIEGDNYIRKASEIKDISAQNIILVGGPCANPISEQITDESGYNCDDWKFDFGQSIVKVFENGQNQIVLIAGTSREDTRKISDAVIKYKTSNKLTSSEEVLFGTPSGNECGNDICETGETDENCFQDCSNEGSIKLEINKNIADLNIYEDYIVFTSSESGDSATISGDEATTSNTKNFVYLLEISSQNIVTVSGDIATINNPEITKIGEGKFVDIYGDYVVFVSYNENRRNVIKLYNIKTKELKIISGGNEESFSEFWTPFIYENKIVYVEDFEKSKPKSVYLYDIFSEETKQIVNISAESDLSDFYENKIVYMGPKYCENSYCVYTTENGVYGPGEVSYQDRDVWMYDFSTRTETKLTSNSQDQSSPVIFGDYVAWIDDKDLSEGRRELSLYNIQNKEQFTLETGEVVKTAYLYDLSLNDNKIVWVDNRNKNKDIYFYDINSGIERRITFNSKDQIYPRIYNNYIVWVDYRESIQDSHIRLYKLFLEE